MSGSSGGRTINPYQVDQGGLEQFLGTEQGKQFKGSYSPGASYVDTGSALLSIKPGMGVDQGTDATSMLRNYEQWARGNQQTTANWNAYSKAVNANEGGQGDNTITAGDAVGQRQQLLGALANAGNPTQPTPGLGSMAALIKNGKQLPPGGAR